MKGDTFLDYAEFQLSPRRTRCELFISADGTMEKLASGFVKPFITHLRAVEVQVAKGNHTIRLESQGGFGKHQQSNNAWFCKGTLERFVRFVSTPEVIERVKTIEDELTQLEQVRSALINTFMQNPDRFVYGDSNPSGQQSRDCAQAAPRRFSTDTEDEGDASKRELLRAMEARLSALHQEQNVAFGRANAAGFDSDNIADLMTFAKDFGAERLNEACAQFLALSRKRKVLKEGHLSTGSPTMQTPSDGSATALASGLETNLTPNEEPWFLGAKRKLDFGVTKLQTNDSTGLQTCGTNLTRKGSGHTMSSGLGPVNQTTESASGGTFLARLQQMAQQVEARPSEEFGWQMDAGMNEPMWQGSPNEAPDSSTLGPAATDETHQRYPGTKEDTILESSHSLPALKVRTQGPGLSTLAAQKAIESTHPENEECKVKDRSKKPEKASGMETDRNSTQGTTTQGETPARRLSVQAAISLFESKKKDSNEPPFRKLIKQESRKTLNESCNSPSEKSVLKRWSGASPRSPEANSMQEKKSSGSGGAEGDREHQLEKTQDEARTIASSDSMVDPQSYSSPDKQARENFKRSLSNLLQLDNSQHFGRPKESSVMVQQPMKQSSANQQPSDNTSGNIPTLESKDHSNIDSLKDLPSTKIAADVSSKPMIGIPLAPIPIPVKPLRRPIPEGKPDSQPAPIIPGSYHNGNPEREDKDKGVMKVKESMPKPSGSVSSRQKVSAQVPSPVPIQTNTMPLPPVFNKSEQASDRQAEEIKLRDVPDSIRQTGKSMSFKTSSFQTKTSPGKEFLTTSVDFDMQALVKMVKHQYTSLSFNGSETPNEHRGEQRGRLYDQYSKLRDARIRGEHPAKRAEKEAKLKSMQETLERRKAEMESRAVKLSKKKVRDARVTDSGGEKAPIQRAGLTVAMVEQKDLKDEDDDTDQEEYSMISQDQVMDYSNPTSPVSTPWSSKNRSSALKSRTSTKVTSTPPKTSGAPRNPARAALSSPRANLKNAGATPSQRKIASLVNSGGDTVAIKAVFNMKDIAKSSLSRTTASARVHPRLNGSSNDVTLGDDANNTATLANPEKKDIKHSSLMTRRNVSSIAVSKILLTTEAGMLLGSPKDQQEGVIVDTMIDCKASLEVRPFLRKGRGIGPGAGPGIMKQKASVLADTSKSSDEDTSTDNKQDGASSLNPEDLISTTENSIKIDETEEAEENNDESKVKEGEALETAGAATLPTVEDDSTSPGSRLSCSEPIDSQEVEALDNLPECAPLDSKSCSDPNSPNEEHQEEASPGVLNVPGQGSFLPAVHNKQKEGSTSMLADLFSQRNTESLPHNAGFVTSSISFREASLPHGQTSSSPFPAFASHTYSSLLQRGAVSSRFSPPRANALDLPTSSPALWSTAQASKYIQEPDMIHSSRHLNGQKLASMLPLPPKEPSKGFKRLLHFGRKNRPAETMITDCVSVSTTSEGDDDADEAREAGSQVSDELLRKLRMQKRGLEYGNVGDQYNFADQDASQFFGSTIPPPPANFKLREDPLSGSNLLKAPRSFFSLSSFRSKGSEGKSR